MKPALALALSLGWVGFVPVASSQALPQATGLYQVMSGAYTMVGGIWGSLTQRLPNAEQAFVELRTDVQHGRAVLVILGQDGQTPFLTLTNGLIAGTVIRFEYSAAHPYPDLHTLGTLDYTVTNLGDGLSIEGDISFSPVCCDIPYLFRHSNVMATQAPILAIRVSEVELCWGSTSNRTYQVQYRSDLTTNLWTSLGPPLVASGSISCTCDKVNPGQPARFYRVLTLP